MKYPFDIIHFYRGCVKGKLNEHYLIKRDQTVSDIKVLRRATVNQGLGAKLISE